MQQEDLLEAAGVWTVADVQSVPQRFEAVYELHYAGIASYVYRRVGDRATTEDLVSDIFLSALRGLPRARRGRAPVRLWLLRIATHAVRRWMRVSARRASGAELLDEHPADESDPQAGLREELRRALSLLHPDRQAALALHYLEGLAIEEIAEVLECRPGTVKSRLARGREDLGRELERRRKR